MKGIGAGGGVMFWKKITAVVFPLLGQKAAVKRSVASLGWSTVRRTTQTEPLGLTCWDIILGLTGTLWFFSPSWFPERNETSPCTFYHLPDNHHYNLTVSVFPQEWLLQTLKGSNSWHDWILSKAELWEDVPWRLLHWSLNPDSWPLELQLGGLQHTSDI